MNKKYYIYKLNLLLLNIFSILLLIGVILFTGIIFYIFKIDISFNNINIFLLLILYFLYMIAHELLHSLSYWLYGAKYKNIVYGMAIEKSILYCLCKENISRKNILNSLMFPLFYLGIVTYIISLIIKSPYLLILSIFNISGSIGDIFMFNFIRKLDKTVEYSEFDDEVSFGIYTDKIDIEKPFGLIYVGKTEKLKREDYTKIKISKVSYLLIVVVLISLFVLLI